MFREESEVNTMSGMSLCQRLVPSTVRVLSLALVSSSSRTNPEDRACQRLPEKASLLAVTCAGLTEPRLVQPRALRPQSPTSISSLLGQDAMLL